MTVIGLSGTKYRLDTKLLNDGGEGEIYRVVGGTSKKVAKIYKAGIPNRELEEKLAIMVNRPPSPNVLSQVAWPLDIVYNVNNQFCGFIMHELNINAELGDIYKYPSQINISTLQKIIIAENICAVISEVHRAGYVFGDFNPRNIGIDKKSGTVAFLDTDTYHVIDSIKNKVYRCSVCAPGYAAPELLEKCAVHIAANPNDNSQAYAKTPLPTFTKETDNFALAVHIFKLLMNGYTPYGGIKYTEYPSQASPGTGDAAVRRDNYCFKPGFKHQSVAIPALDTFPQELSDLFTRAFMFGKLDPTQRPSAFEWYGVLGQYEKALVTCAKNPLHQYHKMNSSCPLCDADQRYGYSMTPPISQKQYNGVVQPPVYAPVQQLHKNAQLSGYSSGTNAPVNASVKKKIWLKPLLGFVAVGIIVLIIINGLNTNRASNALSKYSSTSPVSSTSSISNNGNISQGNSQNSSNSSNSNNNANNQSKSTTSNPTIAAPTASNSQVPKYDDISSSVKVDGSITSDGQEINYIFTPRTTGRYRFEFSGIPNGVYHSLYLFNSGWEQLDRNTGIGNGKGLTMSLVAGKSYFIRVKQSSNNGSYVLNIGHQTANEDISDISKVTGNISFTDQENNYVFAPTLDGLYRFEFSDIPSGVYHSLYIYNSGWEQLDRNTGVGNGKGITIKLEAGQSYYVKIKQSSNLGSYKLNVGSQIEEIDISSKTKQAGNIEFTNQENNYKFIPELDGLYRFEFSDIPNGVYNSLYIFNSGWEQLDRNTGVGNGKGITMTLKSGETYFVRVKQSSNFGSYALNIGHQTTLQDVSSLDEISDIITFTNQENNYQFIALRNGVYRFEFSDIPNSVYHSLYIYNSGWEQLDRNTGIGNGKGLTITLSAGQSYYVRVKQSSNMGSYTLKIGQQTADVNMADTSSITGEITFTHQENNYLFTPAVDGQYRFEFSGISSGVYHSLYVYNSGWEQLDRNTGIGNGKGLTMSLSAGQTYYVKVKQSSNFGFYSLGITQQ